MAAVGGVALALALAACGGSSSKSTKTAATSTSTTTASAAPAAAPAGAAVTTGPVRGVLHARGHAPKIGKLWPYSVTVTDAAGHPLNGTILVEFVFNGTVVGKDIPPLHRLEHGRMHENLTFPARSAGYPLTLRAVVHTAAGSITLDWPVQAHH